MLASNGKGKKTAKGVKKSVIKKGLIHDVIQIYNYR